MSDEYPSVDESPAFRSAVEKVLLADPDWRADPVVFRSSLADLLRKEGMSEDRITALLDEGTGYDFNTSDMMLLMDLAPRRASTSQLRKIITEGMNAGYNRRFKSLDEVPVLDPQGAHAFVPLLVHRYIDQVPSEQHIRCRVLLKTLTSDQPREVILDVAEKSLRRLPRMKPKRRTKPDPTWEHVLEWYVELVEQTESMPAMVDFDPGTGQKLDAPLPLDLLAAMEPWFITSDMVTLTTAAAEGMPSHGLQVSELVTPSGFAILESPFLVDTSRWGVVPIRALLWKLIGPSGVKGWPRSANDRPVVAVVAFMDLEHEDTPPDPVYAPGYRSRLWPVMHWLWPEGEPPSAVLDWENMIDDTDRMGFLAMRKFFMALWLLSGQRVAGITGQKPARGIRKRAARLKLPSTVLVVRLRRESSRNYDGEPAEVEWSHRWIVNGHWRRIWDEKTKRVRLVWVSPYVKGPEDKPLVVKDRIYKFER